MSRLILSAVPILAGLLAPQAHAATHEVCVNIDIWSTDSGHEVNGIGEDYWAGAFDLQQYLVTGRGVRVKLSQGSWSQSFDADPKTGCFVVDRPTSSGFTVRVYGYSTDAKGNVVRVHDAGTASDDWYPNATLQQAWGNQTLSRTEVNTYVLDGRSDARFTTLAAASFALARFPEGNSDTTISLGFSGTCGDSGSTHGSAEQYIESDRAHLIRIGSCPGFGSDAREKFLVTHELGHAWLRLYYGKDGDESPRDQTYNPPVPPGAPVSGSDCVNVSSYDMNSLEWNSQPFKEGFADFYSSRVWNKAEYRGTYVYRSRPYDLETWDVWQGTHQSGGFTGNVCGYGSVAGVSTKGDWLRFLWDFHTMHSCGARPTRFDMIRVYKDVRSNHPGAFALTTSNHDAGILYAIEETVPNLSQCERDAAAPYAAYNGI